MFEIKRLKTLRYLNARPHFNPGSTKTYKVKVGDHQENLESGSDPMAPSEEPVWLQETKEACPLATMKLRAPPVQGAHPQRPGHLHSTAPTHSTEQLMWDWAEALEPKRWPIPTITLAADDLSLGMKNLNGTRADTVHVPNSSEFDSVKGDWIPRFKIRQWQWYL